MHHPSVGVTWIHFGFPKLNLAVWSRSLEYAKSNFGNKRDENVPALGQNADSYSFSVQIMAFSVEFKCKPENPRVDTSQPAKLVLLKHCAFIPHSTRKFWIFPIPSSLFWPAEQHVLTWETVQLDAPSTDHSQGICMSLFGSHGPEQGFPCVFDKAPLRLSVNGISQCWWP